MICDVWNTHWCRTAAQTTAALAQKINLVLETARPQLELVIHAPSDAVAFYEATPQHVRAASLPVVARRLEVELNDAQPPATNRPGCPDYPDCTPVTGPPWPWTRQHPAIAIRNNDLISDREDEIWKALSHFRIDRLAFAGMHVDVCVLDRPFGIRRMRRRQVECVLVADLTEAFWPEETGKILDHVNRHLCPVMGSAEVFSHGR